MRKPICRKDYYFEFISCSASKSCGNEVHFEVPEELNFPDTKFLGESALKLSMRNYSSKPQQVSFP